MSTSLTRITTVRPATREEWDGMWSNSPAATFFHSRAWADVWNAYSEGAFRPHPLWVQFSDGHEALLPLSYRRRFCGLVSEYHSSPAATYGGWLASTELTAFHARLLLEWVKATNESLYWRVNPFDTTAASLAAEATHSDVTNALDLWAGFEAIRANFSKGHRSAVQHAIRAGVTVAAATSNSEWDAYYSVYEDSLRRWGTHATSRYKRSLFRKLRERCNGNVVLWLARHEGQVVAGALGLYAKSHVSYWHSAVLESPRHLRPATLLIYEMIRHAVEHGYRWFDFNPSGGHEGVQKFKARFGTVPLSCPMILHQTPVNRAFQQLALFRSFVMNGRGRFAFAGRR